MSATTSAQFKAEYSVRRTLTVRVELIRQLRRRRTLVALLLALAVPVIVVTAVKLGPSGQGVGNGDLDLVGLATAGAWNFTVTMLLFTSTFLLTVIAALFLGDTVASEASWSTMRYLLVAPVPRRRFLRAKLIVGLLLTASTLLLLVLVSFSIGLIAFGSAPLTSPLGGSFTTSESWLRLAIVTGYIAIQLLIPAGIAFLMSVSTDVPLGAVGTAVVIVILFNIVDSITALGDVRRFLPTHYDVAWTATFDQVIVWNDMAIGASYALVTFVVLVSSAVLRFDRKDILS